jgi:hypothetical protein
VKHVNLLPIPSNIVNIVIYQLALAPRGEVRLDRVPPQQPPCRRSPGEVKAAVGGLLKDAVRDAVVPGHITVSYGGGKRGQAGAEPVLGRVHAVGGEALDAGRGEHAGCVAADGDINDERRGPVGDVGQGLERGGPGGVFGGCDKRGEGVWRGPAGKDGPAGRVLVVVAGVDGCDAGHGLELGADVGEGGGRDRGGDGLRGEDLPERGAEDDGDELEDSLGCHDVCVGGNEDGSWYGWLACKCGYGGFTAGA